MTPHSVPRPSPQEFAQFLSRLLAQSGPDSLPYDEDLKISIRHHLVSLVQEFSGLHIKTDTFTHNDGKTLTLLQAVGTIPMFYLEVQYNIPVTIWLPERYPKCPPLVYVSPTRDMIIKRPHPHVDPSGLISVPYLQGWIFPRSSLVELVKGLSLLFGQNPPLYSKPPSYNPPPATSFQEIHRPASVGPSASSVRPPSSSSPVTPSPPASQPSFSHPRHPPPTSSASSKQESSSSESFRRHAISTLMDRVQRDVIALKKRREADTDKLTSMQPILKQRGDQFKEGLSSLQREKEALEHQLQLVLTNTDVLETWLTQNTKTDMEFDVDDAFELCDVLSKQLLECTCADLAIEDILYALDKAVQEGAVPVEAYLKHVRNISREQFFHKAMAEKVRAAQAQTQIDMIAARAGRYLS